MLDHAVLVPYIQYPASSNQHPPLSPHQFRIDHNLNAAVASAAGVRAVGDDRVRSTMTDDEELPRLHAAAAQCVINCHRLGDGQMLIGWILGRPDRTAIGMTLNANELLR